MFKLNLKKNKQSVLLFFFLLAAMTFVVDKKIMNKPKEKYWISYIKQRIKQNKNFLGFISGQTGSGKSYSSISIGEELDPDFDVDRCVFSGIELMKLINSGKLKRGSVIIFEEVGVELSNKNWQSIANKMLNYLMQTFRHRGFILIMNSPFVDFVDASTRKLFHAELQTIGIDFKKSEVKLKPQILQYNSRMKKFYHKRLKVITERGRVPIDTWRVPKPSEELRLAYEAKKSEYTNKLNERILKELTDFENKANKKSDNPLTEIQQDTLQMLKDGLNIHQIAAARSRSETAVKVCVKAIKNRGYKLNAQYMGDKIDKYEVIEPDER